LRLKPLLLARYTMRVPDLALLLALQVPKSLRMRSFVRALLCTLRSCGFISASASDSSTPAARSSPHHAVDTAVVLHHAALNIRQCLLYGGDANNR
jgi:hypothetical protein